MFKIDISIWLPFFRHHAHHHHHDTELLIWLRFSDFAIVLQPKRNGKAYIMRQIHVDTLDQIGIIATDKDGNVVSPIPIDEAPIWTNSDDTVATISLGANGLSVTLNPTKIDGVTTVTVSAKIGGTTFIASADYSVISGSIAKIDLTDTFSPKP